MRDVRSLDTADEGSRMSASSDHLVIVGMGVNDCESVTGSFMRAA